MRDEFTRLSSVKRLFGGVRRQKGRVPVDADSDEQDYVFLRRVLLFLETSVAAALRWATFEPDDRPGWRRRRRRR